MTEPVHKVRGSLYARDRTYEIGPDALKWREKTRSGEIRYEYISKVRLSGYASMQGEHYQCAITWSGGTLKIRSHHFAGYGQFEDRTATYAPFIRALTDRIASRSHGVRYVAGSTAMLVVWVGLGICLALFGLLLPISLFAGGTAAAAIPMLLICVLGVPMAVRQVRKGRASSFDPRNPPASLLGKR